MFIPCPCSCENLCSANGPIVWARIGIGYRIENLHKKYFNHAATLIQHYYFEQDALMQSAGFRHDHQSIANFTAHCIEIMMNQSSLILIDEHDNTIIGVLLLSIVNRLDFGRAFSHSDMRRGAAYEHCIALKNSMHKKLDFFLDYATESLLRFYLLCVADEHLEKGLEYHLFRVGLEIARHLHVPIACGVFTSPPMRALAAKLGFEVVDTCSYDELLEGSSSSDDNIIALMVMKVPVFYSSPMVTAERKASGKSAKSKKGGKGKKKK